MAHASDFDYELPALRIAQQPIEPRTAAKLLVDRGPDSAPCDMSVGDLPGLIGAGDVIVVNKTRVLPARLNLHKLTGGMAEVLLLDRVGESTWEALIRPSRRVPAGAVLTDREGLLEVVAGDPIGDGVRLVDLAPGAALADEDADEGAGRFDLVKIIEAVGQVPLPPYLSGSLEDPERYQTVFSKSEPPLSSAAPTAGLHLTDALVAELEQRCDAVVAIDLTVGLGTFRPITAELVEDHPMHTEYYRVDRAVWETIRAADRVVAVGTTTVRTLETVARTGELEGRTDLFIRDGFEFEVVDRLMTNFHLPRSSLLVMIEAFAGPRWRELYEHAMAGGYRFLSFGDAMLLTRKDLW